MRKDSDMMQVDVVHCCQVEKEVAILEVEEEVRNEQLAVDKEEEGNDAIEASDASSLPLVEACCHLFFADGSMRCRCLSSRPCHLFSLMAPMSLLLVEALLALLFRWLMLPQLLVAAMPSGHVEMQATMQDESHSVAAQSWASI